MKTRIPAPRIPLTPRRPMTTTMMRLCDARATAAAAAPKPSVRPLRAGQPE